MRLNQELVRAQNTDDSARLIEARQQLRNMTKIKDELLSDKYVQDPRLYGSFFIIV